MVVTKDSQYLMIFFCYSGFAPIPVETGGSAPAATSSSEELGPSAGSAVQTSTSRPKEDPAPAAPPSSATPQKINGEYEYKVSCPISMISVHGCFLVICNFKIYLLWCIELAYVVWFVPSCVKNRSRSKFIRCNSEINLCAGCHRSHFGRFRVVLRR